MTLKKFSKLQRIKNELKTLTKAEKKELGILFDNAFFWEYSFNKSHNDNIQNLKNKTGYSKAYCKKICDNHRFWLYMLYPNKP